MTDEFITFLLVAASISFPSLIWILYAITR